MVVIIYCLLHSTQKCKTYAMSRAGGSESPVSIAHGGSKQSCWTCTWSWKGLRWRDPLSFIVIRAPCKMLPGISILQTTLPVLFWACGISKSSKSGSSPFLFQTMVDQASPPFSYSSLPRSLGKQLTALLPSWRKDINAEKVKCAALWVGMLWNLHSLASLGGHQEFN